MYEPYLKHHGVKGMRWGVRRSRLRGGETSSARKSRGPSSTKQKRVKRGLRTAGTIAISVAAVYVAARRAGIDRVIAPVAAQSFSSAARNTRTIRRGREALNFRNKIDPMLDFRQTL